MAVVASLSSSVSKFAVAGLMLVGLAVGGTQAQARQNAWWQQDAQGAFAQESIALADLPAQGQRTYQAILNGGPFRHEKDGTVFGNRERMLPRERRGYYHEYTVETPGARDRGARRIVCGGEGSPPQACWYTADHYGSFKRIVP